MNGIRPVAMSTSSKTNGSASTSNNNFNELGPDAFITLLTTQLQSQDPLNPMDPNQMVNELTSMNTLQEIIQIRQDMDSLVTASQPASQGNGGVGGSQAASAAKSLAPERTSAGNAPSSAALASGLAALMKSLAPSSNSGVSSPLNSQ